MRALVSFALFTEKLAHQNMQNMTFGLFAAASLFISTYFIHIISGTRAMFNIMLTEARVKLIDYIFIYLLFFFFLHSDEKIV